MKLLREYIRALLKEDPMGFVHDLAASDNFAKDFFGGKIDKAMGRDIKRAFADHADHQWLSTLDTVHWTKQTYALEDLAGQGKDELSTTMALPSDPLRGIQMFGTEENFGVGLWIKGRITLASDQQDAIFSGFHGDYGAPVEGSEEEVAHRDKSSGRNKRPTMSKMYKNYGQLERGNEYMEKMARNIPYVLDQSTWNPNSSDSTNEALVDNWRPVALVVHGAVQRLVHNVTSGEVDRSELAGQLSHLFKVAEKFDIPIVNLNREELWNPK